MTNDLHDFFPVVSTTASDKENSIDCATENFGESRHIDGVAMGLASNLRVGSNKKAKQIA